MEAESGVTAAKLAAVAVADEAEAVADEAEAVTGAVALSASLFCWEGRPLLLSFLGGKQTRGPPESPEKKESMKDA